MTEQPSPKDLIQKRLDFAIAKKTELEAAFALMREAFEKVEQVKASIHAYTGVIEQLTQSLSEDFAEPEKSDETQP